MAQRSKKLGPAESSTYPTDPIYNELHCEENHEAPICYEVNLFLI